VDENTTFGLDDLDIAIVSHLIDDGRKPFSDIAKDLDVAVNTVRNRVARMVDNGLLTFLARVKPERVGFQAYANILISVESSSQVESVAAQLVKYPEVSFVSMVMGKYDLLIDVMCYDNLHLRDLLTERIHKIPGVKQTESILMIKVLKWEQPSLLGLKEYWSNKIPSENGADITGDENT